ncbi:hypothetical protein A3770_04p32760 [Chloropicon primus]|uniref:Uncharacterized protein n=1 Tax=Chloropicon primus TaxID=1764295 RepID=A0A5B8MJH0_9CHLO|nr:hypothetical protein A3770_04p32760 [Chloropicon primus]|eukprot:QDZ20758.1 hypothetical protein A3770_04p32760 [Chloropicon primus]
MSSFHRRVVSLSLLICLALGTATAPGCYGQNERSPDAIDDRRQALQDRRARARQRIQERREEALARREGMREEARSRREEIFARMRARREEMPDSLLPPLTEEAGDELLVSQNTTIEDVLWTGEDVIELGAGDEVVPTNLTETE